MKAIDFNKMEALKGGNLSNRSCMLLGGVTFAGLVLTAFYPIGFGVAAAGAISAINGGCFE